MDKIKLGYMTEGGYVEEEVSFEEIEPNEANQHEIQEVNWQDNEEPRSANPPDKSTKGIREASTETKEFLIASIDSWPEFKTDWKMSCVKVFGKEICTKTPQLFTRACNRKVYASLSYPSDYADQVKNDITDCAKIAAAAAVTAAITTGAIGAAPAFEVAFKSCALAKFKESINDISIAVDSSATCGEWKPR